jgi:hypothetical protein
MALQIPNGFALVSYKFALIGDAEPMYTTVGMDFAAMAGGDQENANLAADQLLNGYTAAQIITGWTYLGVVCKVGIPAGQTVTIEAPRAVVGQSGEQSPPNNCALLVRKRTAVAGRRGAGRMYIPPFGVGEGGITASGAFPGADLAYHQARINGWFNLVYPWYLLHDELPVPMNPTLISSFVVDARVATQRRRLRR